MTRSARPPLRTPLLEELEPRRTPTLFTVDWTPGGGGGIGVGKLGPDSVTLTAPVLAAAASGTTLGDAVSTSQAFAGVPGLSSSAYVSNTAADVGFNANPGRDDIAFSAPVANPILLINQVGNQHLSFTFVNSFTVLSSHLDNGYSLNGSTLTTGGGDDNSDNAGFAVQFNGPFSDISFFSSGNRGVGDVAATVAADLTASTSTAVNSSLPASVYGQSVTFTATVTNPSGFGGVPTGAVTFKDTDGTVLASGVPVDASGQAQFSTSGLAAADSPHTITAEFTGTGLFDNSSGQTIQNVARAPLTVTANNATKVYGDPNPAFSVSYSPFANNDTPASLGGTLAFSTPPLSTLHVAGSPYAITPSGLTSDNYDITFVSGHLSVTPAPLTVSAKDATKVYGDPNPAFTASYTGLVNGDTPAALRGTLRFSTPPLATLHVADSPYDITPSGLTSSDYHITFAPGRLTVTPAPLTVTADDQTKAYGQPNPTFTAHYNGFVNGDRVTDLGGRLAFATPATQSSHVAGGPYTITASGLTSTDYRITYVPGRLTITPAPLTVSADDKTKGYGQANPTLTASYSGFVLGETPAVLGGALVLNTPATRSSHVAGGPYTITASGLTSTDYAITFLAGKLTVTPAPLTVTADDKSKVYGQANPPFTASYSGFVLGETPAVLGGALAFGTPATVFSHVASGPYAITPSGLTSTDYAITFLPGKLAVTPAPLTVSADNKTKVYGQANPPFTASYTGLVNGDRPAILGGALTFATPATAASHVAGSPFAVTPSGLTSTDYTITFVNGLLTVTPAPLTVTATSLRVVAGSPVPAFTAQVAGLVNGDTPAALGGNLAVGVTVLDTLGNARLTPAGLTSTDYTITFVRGSLTILANATSIASAGVAGSGVSATAATPPFPSLASALNQTGDAVRNGTPATNVLAALLTPTALVGGGGGAAPPPPDVPGSEGTRGQGAPTTARTAVAPVTLVSLPPLSTATAKALALRSDTKALLYGAGDEELDEEGRDRLSAGLGAAPPEWHGNPLGGIYLDTAASAEQPESEPTEDPDAVDPNDFTNLWFVVTIAATEVTLMSAVVD